MSNSCKYYMERTLGWMLNNKVIVLLSLLSFCLFVSTWALAAQKNGYQRDLADCRNALHDATTTSTTILPTSSTGTETTTTATQVPITTNKPPSDGDDSVLDQNLIL